MTDGRGHLFLSLTVDQITVPPELFLLDNALMTTFYLSFYDLLLLILYVHKCTYKKEFVLSHGDVGSNIGL
jgi:hypothetical protein